jgi:hypothetical protein
MEQAAHSLDPLFRLGIRVQQPLTHIRLEKCVEIEVVDVASERYAIFGQ